MPELEPLDGLVAVAEVETALDLTDFDEADGAGPFTLELPARIVGRLDEHPYADMDDDPARLVELCDQYGLTRSANRLLNALAACA